MADAMSSFAFSIMNKISCAKWCQEGKIENGFEGRCGILYITDKNTGRNTRRIYREKYWNFV